MILIGVVVYFYRRKTVKAVPMEPMRAEKDGEVAQSQPVYHPYHPHEIHEAPGIDAIASDKDPNYPGNK